MAYDSASDSDLSEFGPAAVALATIKLKMTHGDGQVILPAANFLKNIQNRYNSAFSDFTIKSDRGMLYNVHRHIITNHSRYFARLCHGDFQEAKSRIVTLHDDPPQAVQLMVEFFHTFDYNADSTYIHGNDTTKPAVLVLHAMVFTIADKYEIPDLKTHALRKLQAKANERVADYAEFASGPCAQLVAYVYTHAPPHDDSLQRAAVGLWTRANNDLVHHTSKGDMERLVSEYPVFGADLIKQMA
ncbi:hypothetical protein LTR08_007904 [Meristemomyces frigidus]|nr:hypothetical protein LTR08_007904 [Meristemomyces frigidus]